MARRVAMFVAMLMLVGCKENTRPTSNLRNSEDAALQQMAAKHNAKVKDPDQKVVCERVSETGSRIPHLVCRTIWQEKQDKKDAQNYLDAPKHWGTRDK